MLRDHAAGILLVALMAALVVGPRWQRLVTSPGDGVRVQVAPSGGTMGNDEALYAPQVRRAVDGSLPIDDPYQPDRSNAHAQAGMFWQEAVGLSGRVLGGSWAALAIFTTVAACAALLLFYALALEITASRLAALAVLPIAFMVVEALNQAEGFLPLRHPATLQAVLTADPGLNFHAWARFVAPSMALPAFFAAVVALPRALESGEKRWIAGAAGAIGLLVYSYVFYWTAMAVALAGLLLWLLSRRDWTASKRLLIVGAVAVVFTSPELALIALNALRTSADARARVGLNDPGIVWSAWATILQRVLVGVPFVWALRRRDLRHALYVALFAAPLLLAGIDGLAPQPWHYGTQVWALFALPLFIAGATAIVARLRLERMVALRAAFAVVALVGVGHLIAIQTRAAINVDVAYSVTADEDAALRWIDDNVSGSETVVSPSFTTNLQVASLTPARVYLPDGFYSRAPSDAELIDRYLRVQAAFGYGEDDTFKRLEPRNTPFRDTSGSAWAQQARLEDSMAYYLLNWETDDPKSVDDRVEGWRHQFASIRAEAAPLSAYDATYIYCGRRERLWPEPNVAPGTMVTVAFESGDVTVYRIAQASDVGVEAFRGCGG